MTEPSGPAVDEELAAAIVVSILTARSAAAADSDRTEPTKSRWAAREAGLRRPLAPGPGAWRWSCHSG